MHVGNARNGVVEHHTLRPSPASGFSRNSVTSARSSASCLYRPALPHVAAQTLQVLLDCTQEPSTSRLV